MKFISALFDRNERDLRRQLCAVVAEDDNTIYEVGGVPVQELSTTPSINIIVYAVLKAPPVPAARRATEETRRAAALTSDCKERVHRGGVGPSACGSAQQRGGKTDNN